MKDTVPCHSCENCAIGYETGFTGKRVMRCSRLADYVTEEDGCTMGVIGVPGSLCFDYDIDISGNAAVWGWHE